MITNFDGHNQEKPAIVYNIKQDERNKDKGSELRKALKNKQKKAEAKAAAHNVIPSDHSDSLYQGPSHSNMQVGSANQHQRTVAHESKGRSRLENTVDAAFSESPISQAIGQRDNFVDLDRVRDVLEGMQGSDEIATPKGDLNTDQDILFGANGDENIYVPKEGDTPIFNGQRLKVVDVNGEKKLVYELTPDFVLGKNLTADNSNPLTFNGEKYTAAYVKDGKVILKRLDAFDTFVGGKAKKGEQEVEIGIQNGVYKYVIVSNEPLAENEAKFLTVAGCGDASINGNYVKIGNVYIHFGDAFALPGDPAVKVSVTNKDNLNLIPRKNGAQLEFVIQETVDKEGKAGEVIVQDIAGGAKVTYVKTATHGWVKLDGDFSADLSKGKYTDLAGNVSAIVVEKGNVRYENAKITEIDTAGLIDLLKDSVLFNATLEGAGSETEFVRVNGKLTEIVGNAATGLNVEYKGATAVIETADDGNQVLVEYHNPTIVSSANQKVLADSLEQMIGADGKTLHQYVANQTPFEHAGVKYIIEDGKLAALSEREAAKVTINKDGLKDGERIKVDSKRLRYDKVKGVFVEKKGAVSIAVVLDDGKEVEFVDRDNAKFTYVSAKNEFVQTGEAKKETVTEQKDYSVLGSNVIEIGGVKHIVLNVGGVSGLYKVGRELRDGESVLLNGTEHKYMASGQLKDVTLPEKENLTVNVNETVEAGDGKIYTLVQLNGKNVFVELGRNLDSIVDTIGSCTHNGKKYTGTKNSEGKKVFQSSDGQTVTLKAGDVLDITHGLYVVGADGKLYKAIKSRGEVKEIHEPTQSFKEGESIFVKVGDTAAVEYFLVNDGFKKKGPALDEKKFDATTRLSSQDIGELANNNGIKKVVRKESGFISGETVTVTADSTTTTYEFDGTSLKKIVTTGLEYGQQVETSKGVTLHYKGGTLFFGPKGLEADFKYGDRIKVGNKEYVMENCQWREEQEKLMLGLAIIYEKNGRKMVAGLDASEMINVDLESKGTQLAGLTEEEKNSLNKEYNDNKQLGMSPFMTEEDRKNHKTEQQMRDAFLNPRWTQTTVDALKKMIEGNNALQQRLKSEGIEMDNIKEVHIALYK